jgi:hypothetical protein
VHDLPGDGGGDEELRTVGVLSRVGHREKTLLAVLQLEVLIWELGAVDYNGQHSSINAGFWTTY